MNELQQNRYDTLLRRVGGLIGPGSKAGEILSEVFPMIDIEGIKGELQLLGQTYTCMGGGVITGDPGESPRAQLFNPADSNVLLTLTSVMVSHTATDIVRYGRRDIALAASVDTQIFTDFRNPVANLPVGEINQLSSVALANATGQFRLLSNTPFYLKNSNDLAILPPNTGWEIGLVLATASLHYTFFWRERVAELSELNV